MHLIQLSWRLLLRDWRAGELRLLAAALVVAVGALSSVGFFVDRTQAALQLQARQLLGADLVVASDAPLPSSWSSQAESLGLQQARTVSFPSMAMGGTERPPLLVSLKAVDPGYPLRGGVRIARGPASPDEPAQGAPAPGTVWVDPQLLGGLELRVGDRLSLGDATFTVAALITLEVDRGANFVNFAPRVLMGLADLPATGLVQPASRVTWRTLFAGEPASVARFEAWTAQHSGAGRRIETIESGRPELRMTLDRAEQFLALVSLLSALIAAVAIGVSATRFAERHLDGAAVMRAMGLTHRKLLGLLLLEMLWLAVLTGVIGALIGWLGQGVLVRLAAPFMALSLPAPSLGPALAAFVAGLILLAGFAGVPLVRLAGVTPLRVLRRDLGAPRLAVWVAVLSALAAFSLLLVWFAGDRRLAGFALAGFVAGAVLFVSVAWLAVRTLAPLRNRFNLGAGSAALRVALASWARRRGGAVVQISALAVGLMALLLLTVTRADLIASWERASPPDAPNRFVINIQPDQRDEVMDELRQSGVQALELHPMVRGRLIAINDEPVNTEAIRDERTRRLMEREFNLSYMARMQAHNRLVAGRWLEADAPEVSIEEGILKTLGLAIGDRLSFEIAGETVSVTAVGVRKVAWDSMNVNFFMVLSPKALADRPQSWITSFHLPPGQADPMARLVTRYPNLTVFDTSAIVRQVQLILEQVVRAIQFLFLFTLAAGVVVLYAALASSRDDRIREAALMRALGASRAQLSRAQTLELVVTGGLAGLMAAAGALAVGMILASQVFQFEMDARWMSLPLGAALGAGLSVVAGFFSLRAVVSAPALSALRNV